MRYFPALFMTIALEALVVALLTRRPNRARVVMTSLFVNLFTHPIAWSIVVDEFSSFLAVEAGVVVVETLLYAFVVPMSLRRAFVVSLVANLATIAMTFVLRSNGW